VPEENHTDLHLHRTSRKTVLNMFRPAQCPFKVNRIMYALNKGIRIEENKLDLAKLKSCKELINVRLMVMENIKMNLRIIIHGMTRRNDIRRN